MRGIKELRQRVLAAEERFGLNDAERAAYSERLVVLMSEIEGRIGDQKFKIKQQAAVIKTGESEAAVLQAKIDGQGTAIAQQAETIEKLKASGARKTSENEQLRAMLHSMLQTIESGGRDGLAEAMQELDRKVSALMSAAAAEPEDAPVAEESHDPMEEAEDVPTNEVALESAMAAMGLSYEDEDAAVIEAEEAATAESYSEEFEEPVAEETDEPVAEETDEPVAEETDEPVAEEIEEPVAEEVAEDIDAPVDEIDESVAEALAPEAATESDGQAAGGSLDDIMERVSKLVEETEAAVAAPEPCAPEEPPETVAESVAEEIVEEPAQLATGTDS